MITNRRRWRWTATTASATGWRRTIVKINVLHGRVGPQVGDLFNFKMDFTAWSGFGSPEGVNAVPCSEGLGKIVFPACGGQ